MALENGGFKSREELQQFYAHLKDSLQGLYQARGYLHRQIMAQDPYQMTDVQNALNRQSEIWDLEQQQENLDLGIQEVKEICQDVFELLNGEPEETDALFGEDEEEREDEDE